MSPSSGIGDRGRGGVCSVVVDLDQSRGKDGTVDPRMTRRGGASHSENEGRLRVENRDKERRI